MAIADDIAQARAEGRSDQDILTAIQGYAPQYAGNIQDAQTAGHNPTDIVNAVVGYDSANGPEAQKSTFAKVTDPFRYGAAQSLRGVASTLDQTARATDPSMAIADQIDEARAGGVPDAELVPLISQVAPQYTSDIDGMQKLSASPTDILNAIHQHDSLYGPKVSGQSGVVSNALKSTADAIAPADYTPAHATWNPTTWLKALAEGAAGMGQDVAAGEAGATAGAGIGALGNLLGPEVGIPAMAAGGLIGGGLGAIASYGARNFGDDARRAAIARTGDPGAQPNTEDWARAMASSVIGGTLGRLGFKGSIGTPATAMGGSVLGQVLPQIARGAAIDGATGAAASAAQQGLISRNVDPAEVAGAAGTSGLAGAGIRGLGAVQDANTASRFGGLTPETARPVAQKLIAADMANGNDGTADLPARSYDAVTKVRDDLQVQANTLASDPNVLQHIAALQDADQSDTTRQTLATVRKDISENRTPNPDDIQTLNDTIGMFPHGSDLIDTLQHQATLNKIIGLGNLDDKAGTFTGGLAGSPAAQSVLNPVSPKAGLIDAGAAVFGATGHTLPGLAVMHALSGGLVGGLALPTAQASIYGGLRGIDAFTGNRAPVGQFLNRFGGGNSPSTDPSFGGNQPPVTGPRPPAYLDVLDQAKASQLAQKLSDTQTKQAAQAAQSAKLSDALAAARAQSQHAADLRQQISAVPYIAKLQAASGEGSSATDVSHLIAVNKAAARLQAATEAATDRSGNAAIKQAARASLLAAKLSARANPPEPPNATPSGPASVVTTTPLVHQDGVRNQVHSEVRQAMSSVTNGMNTRADARRAIMTEARSLPLSGSAKVALAGNTAEVLRQVFNVSKPAHAKGIVEDHLEKLSPADAQIIRQHLLEHVDPTSGHTFYGTWQ